MMNCMGGSREDGLTALRRLSALDGKTVIRPSADSRPQPSETIGSRLAADAVEPVHASFPENVSSPAHAVPPPKTGPPSRRAVPMGALMGVRSSDADGRQKPAGRDRPRLSFRPLHSLMAVLLLAAALCASLTMLIQQSLRYAMMESAASRSQPAYAAHDEEDDAVEGTGDAADGGNDGGAGAKGDDKESQSSASQSDGTLVDGDVVDAHGGRDSTLIDINSATADQLDTIPGVGPATAQRILDHRRRIGRFTSVDQLLDVNGIGAKTLEKIRPWVRV